MAQRIPYLPILLCLLAAFAFVPTTAEEPDPSPVEDNEIYTCEDENGSVVLQTDPCPPKAARRERPKPKPKKPPAPRKPDPTPVKSFTKPGSNSWIVIPPRKHGGPAAVRQLGTQTFPTGIDGDQATPSYETPERTWRTLLTAIDNGDSAAAAACFTPEAASSIRLEDLRALLDSFTRIENRGDLGPLWAIQGVRTNRRPKWIFFEELPSGEWKLTGL